MSQLYELMFIVSGKILENDTEKVIEKIKKQITDNGGKIVSQQAIGRKKFAYPISHQKHGFYQIFELELPGDKLKTIERELQLNKTEILRFLLIKTEPQEKRPERIREATRKTVETPKKVEKKVVKSKLSLEDLDKKLDEILDQEIIK